MATTFENRLSLAVAKQRAGDSAGAETLYRSVLRDRPRDADALRLLGGLLSETRRAGEGLEFLERAIRIAPKKPEVWLGYAGGMRAKGDLAAAADAYRRALALNPNPSLLLSIGNGLEGVGAVDEAAGAYRALLAAAPNNAAGLQNLGVTLMRLNRLEEALDVFSRCEQVSKTPSATIGRAEALFALGREDEAAICFSSVGAAGLNAQGAVLLTNRRFEEALSCFDESLAMDARNADALLNRGIALCLLDRLKDGVRCYSQALALQPRRVDALNLLANALQRLGRIEDAIKAYHFALQNEPENPDILSRLGQACLNADRPLEAIDACDRALKFNPKHSDALFNLAVTFMKLRRFPEAIARFRELVEINPDDLEYFLNLGNALLGEGNPEEAVHAFQNVVEKAPDFAGGYYSLAAAFSGLSDFGNSIELYDRAYAMEPSKAIRFARGCLLLMKGSYEGWEGYDHRWSTETGLWNPPTKAPIWHGEPLDGKEILVVGEQGAGDHIQFVRYIEELNRRGACVTLNVAPHFHRLFRSTGESIDLVASPPERPLDFQIAMMSVPGACGPDMPIPATPYLHAEPEKIEFWRNRIGTQGFKIAIAWQGNPDGAIDIGRSAPLLSFKPLSLIPGVRLISVQKNAGVEQLENLPPDMRVESLGDDFDTGADAFLDAAAVMAVADLVVTIDTGLCHLAGALGRPTWLALRKVAEWRWRRGRFDTPWYPTMRLFRQTTSGDWNNVFAEMSETLAQKLASEPKPAL